MFKRIFTFAVPVAIAATMAFSGSAQAASWDATFVGYGSDYGNAHFDAQRAMFNYEIVNDTDCTELVDFGEEIPGGFRVTIQASCED